MTPTGDFVEITSPTAEFIPVPGQDLVTHTAGAVQFEGWRMVRHTLLLKPALLYTVKFIAKTAGDHTLGIDPTNDEFGMSPGSGSSTHVYAASLDEETITVVNEFKVNEITLLSSKTTDFADTTTLDGDLATGFSMALDPTDPSWTYFNLGSITSTRPLEDGEYSFYFAGSDPLVKAFDLNVDDDGDTFFLEDAHYSTNLCASAATTRWVITLTSVQLQMRLVSPMK